MKKNPVPPRSYLENFEHNKWSKLSANQLKLTRKTISLTKESDGKITSTLEESDYCFRDFYKKKFSSQIDPLFIIFCDQNIFLII